MPGGGAHFSSVELAEVLSHYNIGVIHQARPLNAGNKRAPKMMITSEKAGGRRRKSSCFLYSLNLL
jgi:hypothetical protein